MEWLPTVDEGESLSSAQSFRLHRHDVLNQLQLIRARIQMGQEEKALIVVDRMAGWLQSLSTWQSVLPEAAHSLLWCMAACSHVLTEGILANPLSFTADVVILLEKVLHRIEEASNLQGIYVRIQLQNKTTSSENTWVITLLGQQEEGWKDVTGVFQTEQGVPITVKVV
jgi:Sensor_kinase_SpoOB-type, alpha-helical domain